MKAKTEFQKNKTKKDGLQSQCKSCKKETNRKWIENNRHVRRAYRKMKRDSDPLFRAKGNMRNRLNNAFKRKRWNKNSTTAKMLGADIYTVKTFIEVQFTEGMSWDNYGKGGWEIDHVIPLASATTEEELIKLCHYTNLQPLWAEDNLKKKDKIL